MNKYICISNVTNITHTAHKRRQVIRQKYTTYSFHYNDECSSIFFFFLILFRCILFDIAPYTHMILQQMFDSHRFTNQKISDLLSPADFLNAFLCLLHPLLPIRYFYVTIYSEEFTLCMF